MSKTENIKKAFDSTTTNGKLVTLNTAAATEFITDVKNESVLLKLVRFVSMNTPNKDIAKLFAGGRFLHPGRKDEQLASSKRQEFGSEIITLTSKLVRGQFLVLDSEIEDNIAGGKVTDTFVSMIAAKTANELEEIGMYAKKPNLDEEDIPSTLHQFKGWKQKMIESGNIVDAKSGAFANRDVEKAKFTKALKSLATRHRTNALWLMPSDVFIDYSSIYDTVADAVVKGELTSRILKKNIVEVPLFRVNEPVYTATTTTVASTAAAGQKVINFTSAASFTAGEQFAVNLDTNEEQVFTVASKSTNAVTCVENVLFDIASASTITKVTLDGADVLLTDPKNLIYAIQNSDMSFETERVASVGWKYHWRMRIDFNMEDPQAACLIRNLDAV